MTREDHISVVCLICRKKRRTKTVAKEEAARESRTKAEENILLGFLLIEVMSVVALSKECGGRAKGDEDDVGVTVEE